MRQSISSTHAQVQAKTRPFPELRAAYDAIYRAIAARDDAALLLSGSLVGDTVVSDMSDLDIEVVARPGTDIAALDRWVKDLVRGLGKVIAEFPATHLHLPDLEIVFVERRGTVLKVDVWTMSTEGLPFVAGAVAVHDPGGFVAAARAALAEGGGSVPDYGDLHHKLVGWTWFTFTKLRRGQLFEAVESLDVMRSFALLPFLHLLESNPPHGYRYLEQRLPAPRRAALLATFPRAHEEAEIFRALLATADLFRSIQPEVSAKLGAPLRAADLERMVQLIHEYDARRAK